MDAKRLPAWVRPLKGGGLANIASSMREQQAPRAWRRPRRLVVEVTSALIWLVLAALVVLVLAHAG